jgi:hypothetical protein
MREGLKMTGGRRLPGVSVSNGMKCFVLNRTEDISGSSGTGIVAEGVEFSDGTVALRWLTSHTSTAIYDSMSDLTTIHGHNGTTQVLWTGGPIPKEEGDKG